MNKAVRDYIVANYQPWRQSAAASVHRGAIGAPGASPLHEDTRNYFTRRGIPIEGRLYEDLIEDELLAVFDRVSS